METNLEKIKDLLTNKKYNELKKILNELNSADIPGILEEFDKVTEEALADYPMYKTLMDCKIAECQNSEIQKIYWQNKQKQ